MAGEVVYLNGWRAVFTAIECFDCGYEYEAAVGLGCDSLCPRCMGEVDDDPDGHRPGV